MLISLLEGTFPLEKLKSKMAYRQTRAFRSREKCGFTTQNILNNVLKATEIMVVTCKWLHTFSESKNSDDKFGQLTVIESKSIDCCVPVIHSEWM